MQNPATHQETVSVLMEHAQLIVNALQIAKVGVCIAVNVAPLPRGMYMSDTAVELFGHPREALLSKSIFDFIAPEERERMMAIGARRMAGEKTDPIVETVVVRADGSRLPVAYAVAELHIEGQKGFVGFIWDISEQRAEEARLRRLIESAPDGIVISRNGVVLDANPAAARMLGFESSGALTGQSLHALMSPFEAETMKQRVQAGAQGAHLVPRTYAARRADGKRVLAEITSVPYEHEGQPAVIGFARDVTERVQLEAKLLQSQRLASLGTLAAGVAHEVNNPLAVMSIGLTTLQGRLAQLSGVPDEERESLQGVISEVRAGVDRVAGIVRELRTFARVDADEPMPINVLDVLAVAERMTAHQLRPRARLFSEHAPVPLVLGHAHRLEQVFVNLLLNAAQALPDGRAENRVHIRVRSTPERRVMIEIEDNGAGMTPEVLERAFDPFFTTKPVGEGTGVGLSICHEIVSQIGGEIVLDSEAGRGTRVRVMLQPAPHGTVVAAQPTVAPAAPKTPSRVRVLIVDDEPSLAVSLRVLISDEHDVSTVNRGEAACSMLLRGPSFDVILCDVTMPDMSGMDVYARIAAERPDLLPRFVFMTGGACSPRAEEFLARTTNPVIEKPFEHAALRAVIAEVATRNRSARPPGP